MTKNRQIFIDWCGLKVSPIQSYFRYLAERQAAIDSGLTIEHVDEYISENYSFLNGKQAKLPDDFDYMGFDFEAVTNEEDFDFGDYN